MIIVPRTAVPRSVIEAPQAQKKKKTQQALRAQDREQREPREYTLEEALATDPGMRVYDWPG
jgi:hypothetical protein